MHKKHKQPDMYQPKIESGCIIKLISSEFCRHSPQTCTRHGHRQPQHSG